jgi:hypothetical protein
MAKYDKKAALKIMIEAVKQYEEKLNDKQFLIIYRERKDIKTVNVGFRDMNFLHMTGVKTRLSAQQFYAACEYYGAAEPPVRCGESHLSGLTEPLRSL